MEGKSRSKSAGKPIGKVVNKNEFIDVKRKVLETYNKEGCSLQMAIEISKVEESGKPGIRTLAKKRLKKDQKRELQALGGVLYSIQHNLIEGDLEYAQKKFKEVLVKSYFAYEEVEKKQSNSQYIDQRLKAIEQTLLELNEERKELLNQVLQAP